jgi:hypothetical protein
MPTERDPPAASETVVVPKEPTRAMCFEGARAGWAELNIEKATAADVWRAMIAAAPAQPSAATGEGVVCAPSAGGEGVVVPPYHGPADHEVQAKAKELYYLQAGSHVPIPPYWESLPHQTKRDWRVAARATFAAPVAPPSQPGAGGAQLRYRSECNCACHSRPGAMHMVPCCQPDPSPSSVDRAEALSELARMDGEEIARDAAALSRDEAAAGGRDDLAAFAEQAEEIARGLVEPSQYGLARTIAKSAALSFDFATLADLLRTLVPAVSEQRREEDR